MGAPLVFLKVTQEKEEGDERVMKHLQVLLMKFQPQDVKLAKCMQRIPMKCINSNST